MAGRNPFSIAGPAVLGAILVPAAILLGLALGLMGYWLLAVIAAIAAGAAMPGLVRAIAAPAPTIAPGQGAADSSETAILQTIVDALPDPLLTVDARRRLMRANMAARNLVGAIDPGADLATALRDPALLAACDGILADRQARSVEFAWHGAVERNLRADMVALPGGPRGAVVVVLRDLTALKRAERMRADFVANASHELKTPIAALAGFIETLRGPARDDEKARDRFLGIMNEQAQRMARLVADLLSLSQIELNEHERPSAPVDMLKLLRGVVDIFELRARQRGVTLKLESIGRVPVALGDPDQLAQVFQNLIDNALKYAKPGSEVRIELRAEGTGARLPEHGEAVAIAVRDRGEGIAPEHLPRLTERFYRIDSARSRQMGGTGLGLAIVKHIVNRHRGVLEIDSELGKGSVFTVYLPAASSAALARTEPELSGKKHA